jgi:quinol monooxygenase YgiN
MSSRSRWHPAEQVTSPAPSRSYRGIAQQEEGCEQYELFQSLDDPDKVVLLKRWASQASLDKHMEAERTRNASAIDALIALWAPAVTPTVERFED